ncbi:hypothetical protein [Cecembia calidifontis]|jgi:hypothetical protein|nr:hypothetical protein [Cecembia calidifontis]
MTIGPIPQAASIIYDIQDEISYRNFALQLGIAYRCGSERKANY